MKEIKPVRKSGHGLNNTKEYLRQVTENLKSDSPEENRGNNEVNKNDRLK